MFSSYFCHRALGDRELETRIKVHMEKLKDHRNKTYGTIQEELESARKNLDMVSVTSLKRMRRARDWWRARPLDSMGRRKTMEPSLRKFAKLRELYRYEAVVRAHSVNSEFVVQLYSKSKGHWVFCVMEKQALFYWRFLAIFCYSSLIIYYMTQSWWSTIHECSLLVIWNNCSRANHYVLHVKLLALFSFLRSFFGETYSITHSRTLNTKGMFQAAGGADINNGCKPLIIFSSSFSLALVP